MVIIKSSNYNASPLKDFTINNIMTPDSFDVWNVWLKIWIQRFMHKDFNCQTDFEKRTFYKLKNQNQLLLTWLSHLEWNWFLLKNAIHVHGTYQIHTSFQNLRVQVITIEPKYLWLSKTTSQTIPPTIITWNKNTNNCFWWYDFHFALKVGVLL